MYVEARDFKPPTTLGKGAFDGRGVVVGILVALYAHFGLPLTVMGAKILYALLMMLLFHIDINRPEPANHLRDDHIVAAQFVRLGRPFDPRRLPNRHVPRLSTAVDHRIVVSKNMNPEHHDEPDMGARPPQAVLDKIARIGDRAQVFAELAQQEQEGDPNGVEEGEANAHEGDVYLGQFVHFFHQGWSTPTTISQDALSALNAVASVTMTADGHIASFEIARTSGDADFDASILAQLQTLKDAGAPIPQPPATVADQYFGQTRNLRFNGRDAN